MENQNIVVIYHGNCPDGVVAAWTFTQKSGFTKVAFHPTTIRELDQDLKMPSLEGKVVYIVDFSYSEKDLRKIASEAQQIFLYDHHETALKVLHDIQIPSCELIIDVTRCGAEITWDKLHGSQNRPWFLKHIRDRDLWLWEHKESKAFAAAFFKDGLHFQTLDKYAKMTPREIRALIAKGQDLLHLETHAVNTICETKILRYMEGSNQEKIPIAMVQSGILTSEIGNALLDQNPSVRIALVCSYSISLQTWKISLRSRSLKDPLHINVADIAQRYKGGGHPCAAGFCCSKLETLFVES
jgi:oligoribonuclease NrnB/cAMP/cGMP phosphodiesterase (DHH superfamily)